MSSHPSPSADPFQYLQIIVLNPDGSLTRNLVLTTVEATPDPSLEMPVLSKDVTINQSHNTWARIFLPRKVLDNPSHKLPLVVYFHGGGFILFSAANTVMHDYCSTIAMETPAVVVSVEYLLAPEHRLPAAYEDAVEALQWIRTSRDEWLTKFADLSNCFLMGVSEGGNISYHAGLRAAGCVGALEPLKIRGLILQQPFFGAVERSGSEKRLLHHQCLPLSAADLMWELSLSVGADRDEYCNVREAEAKMLTVLGWKVMVTGCDGDPLFDRQVEAAELMAKKGTEIIRCFREGGYHGMDVFHPSEANAMAIKLRHLARIELLCFQILTQLHSFHIINYCLFRF